MRELLAAVLAVALQHPTMPAGMTHAEHLRQLQKEAELKKRGALAMGFDQDKTTHAFRTTEGGGSIEVEARDAADEASRTLIRAHLKEIAKAFAAGDFQKPFETHAEVPPGVPEMRRLKDTIRYEYADTPRGAVVRITTKNRAALAAVHAFLAYQTKEHGHGG